MQVILNKSDITFCQTNENGMTNCSFDFHALYIICTSFVCVFVRLYVPLLPIDISPFKLKDCNLAVFCASALDLDIATRILPCNTVHAETCAFGPQMFEE